MKAAIINAALSLYGVKETPGTGDNPVILQMARDYGFSDYVHDSIAWCSLFANHVAKCAGFSSSGKLNARSWMDVGQPTTDPEIGDVVVLWRDDPNGSLGHVGFFISKENGLIYILGGNEGDMVQIEGFDPARLLGYRALTPLI